MPGTRRFRRHLNSLLSGEDSGSDYYYSGSDGESAGLRAAEAEEEEVWRSEWRGEFVAVGGDFFDSSDKLEKRNKDGEDGGNPVQRRLRRLERERRERRQQRKARVERRQRRLATVEMVDGDAASPAPSVAASIAPLRPEREGAQPVLGAVPALEKSNADVSDADEDEAMEMETVTVVVSSSGFMRDLWLLIDRPVRSVLRRLSDASFLASLEQLLLSFKAHVRQREASPSRAAVPFAGSSTSPQYRVLPSAMSEELIILMPEPFLRLLTHGALAYHFMHAGAGRRGGRAEDDGLLIVRMQRGWIDHQCSLASYVTAHFIDCH